MSSAAAAAAAGPVRSVAADRLGPARQRQRRIQFIGTTAAVLWTSASVLSHSETTLCSHCSPLPTSPACYPGVIIIRVSPLMEQCRSQPPGQGSVSVPGPDVEMWRPSARCLTKERIAAASTKIIDPNSVPFLPQLYFLPSLLVSTFSINKKKLRNRIFPLFSQI